MATLEELNYLMGLLQADADVGLELVTDTSLVELHHQDADLLDLLDECNFVDWRAPPPSLPSPRTPTRVPACTSFASTPPRPAPRSRTKRPLTLLSAQDYQRRSKKTLYSEMQTSGISCQCKKSRCLKKYCDCFSAGKACGALCGCKDCHNFSDTVIKPRPDFCSCSRNGCATGYCVCKASGRDCSHKCRCSGCKNCVNANTIE